MELKENVAYIKLKRSLDYETDTEYTLTVHIRNLYGRTAETEIKIEVLDVNDETPKFPDFGKNGTVAENKPPGVRVMQVQAIDADGTSANNQVNIFTFLEKLRISTHSISVFLFLFCG